MGLALKAIGVGQVTSSENSVLFAAVGTGKAVIVKCMRFTNPGASAVKVSVKFKRGAGTARLALMQTIAPGTSWVDTGEVVLEYQDAFSALTDTGTVDYVVSGIERDV